MAAQKVRIWAAVAAGIVAVLAAVAALAFPRLLGQTGESTTAPPASPSQSPTDGVTPGTAPASPSGSPSATATATTAGAPAPSSAPGSAAPASRAATLLASMSLEQRAGQVMMVGSPVAGPDAAVRDAVGRLHVGNVFLKGRTTAGANAVAGVVAALKGEAVRGSGGAAPFVATDQEGGQVQILRGPGFSEMPTALAQGSMDAGALRASAAAWGRELAAAGVNVNLAPVMDTVPSAAFAPQNAPIGRFQREFGYSPQTVSAHGIAFAHGMADAGVAAVPKHFPGLGRVTANTDTAAGVADGTTGRHDPYVAPFADAVRAGVQWMMISNARYPAIDPENDAVFSPTVIGGMLRGDLGFRGIVVSDDVCDAVQLSSTAPEQRGVGFLAAGGTMVLCTNAQTAPRLWQGMVDRARSDPAFARTLNAAALAVLEAKDRAGLLPR
ncbi:glycoside hydrolase family 3 N-terminal domain-containing protein [Sinomonas cellulolyticus]|nr:MULTISPECIES: glycoside hydrolase family 3 N-terminal domain-containing protein [Sinomonas]